MISRANGARSGQSLILVGPLPPPYTGQSLSFEMLVDAVTHLDISHDVVNLTGAESPVNRLARAMEYGGILSRFTRAVARRRGTVYITVAQSTQGFIRDLAMIRIARAFGHRVVVHLKGGNYDVFYAAQPAPLQAVIRYALRQCDRILVLGERLRRMYDFEPALSSRVHVVPNGLPERGTEDIASKFLPAAGAGPVRILFLSNLIESKGWIDVLEAMGRLRLRYGPGRVRCDFCGEFQTNPVDDVRVTSVERAREIFNAVVKDNYLENDVAYLGSVVGAAKRAALASAHFFVLPTRYSNEGQPVSIIEAMAYGNVVISTDYRAIPDLVADGLTGCLVPYNDPPTLASTIASLIDDPARYAAMSQAARNRYLERFTREAHLRAILPHLLPQAETVTVG